MKTLETIKDEYAREKKFCEWSDVIYGEDDPAIVDEHFDEVASRYAKEVAREALKNARVAANEAGMIARSMSRVYQSIFNAIEDEKNIPI